MRCSVGVLAVVADYNCINFGGECVSAAGVALVRLQSSLTGTSNV